MQITEPDVDEAISLAFQYGNIDGAHHKMWVIDQMLRALLGSTYDAEVESHQFGDHGPNTYEWDTGICP